MRGLIIRLKTKMIIWFTNKFICTCDEAIGQGYHIECGKESYRDKAYHARKAREVKA